MRTLPLLPLVLLLGQPAFAQTCNRGASTVACLEVREDIGVARVDEVAYSGVPIPATADLLGTGTLEVVDDLGNPVPFQLRPLARWAGVVDDPTRPIRWLEVSIQDPVGANQTGVYRLENVAPGPVATPLTVTDLGGTWSVDTGAAVFVVDPSNPALIGTVTVGGEMVYAHSAGAGPRLDIGGTVLDTASAGEVVIDPGTFRLLQTGPLAAVFALDGHFLDPGGSTLCDAYEPGIPAYQALGFSIELRLARGTADADLRYQLRNECLNPAFGPFPDGVKTLQRASWELPLDLDGAVTARYGGSGDLVAATGDVIVEQRKGAGNPWTRRARVRVDGATVETSEELAEPFVALGDAEVTAWIQMPWMRFREPQALAADGATLSARFVSEPLDVGGAKGIWNLLRIGFRAGSASLPALEVDRDRARAALERGLLVRASLDDVNAAGVLPSLGTDATSLAKTEYESLIATWHEDTVGPGGQHARARTWGSQLWPDTQGSSWDDIDNPLGPTNNPGGLNYWSASRAELLEFLRTGDPRWVWDLALPLTWQQLISAYVNRGENGDGLKNGYALTSPICDGPGGLCEEGQQYRYGGGSDDYTYTWGDLGYLVRPTVDLERRFAQAGATTLARYDIPRENQDERERFVSQVDVTRQVVQHFVQLANCAELVPGAEGESCQDLLLEVLLELSEENLASGLVCSEDLQPPSTSPCLPPGGNPALDWCDCVMPQQFMLNSLILPFLRRAFLNYGDVGGNLGLALARTPWHLYREGLGIAAGLAPDFPTDPERPAIPVAPPTDWLGQPGWDLDTNPYTVQDVDVGDTDPNSTDPSGDEANLILEPNKPQTVAELLLAHAVEPALDLCDVASEALNDPLLLAAWEEYENRGGWWKGSSQILQDMVFGIGMIDVCTGGGGGGGGGGNTTPTVTITGPPDDSSFTEGALVTLTATAGDPEDGDLAAGVGWTSDRDGALGTGASVALTTLSVGEHLVSAVVTDSEGLMDQDTITLTITAGGGGGGGGDLCLVLEEGFESGATGWTMSGLWHLANDTGCAVPGYSSPVTSAWYGQEGSCDFDTGATTVGNLISPPIVGVVTGSTLVFDYRREVEDLPDGTVDFTEVAASSDGIDWTVLWSRDSSDPSLDAWTASDELSLDAFAGQTVQFRFRFDSDDEIDNGFLGWMVDDVVVTGSCPDSTISTLDFETGDFGDWTAFP